MKKNVYIHEIELKKLQIKNKPREEFRRLLEEVKYRGYEVEQLADGRKIVITKPGGKRVRGSSAIKREDFMVWVYNPNDLTLWLITHGDIKNDLEEKGKVNPIETIKIIDALEEVYNGKEPDEVLKDMDLSNPCKEQPELLLKAYKWIWGQEDCNYPEGKGRAMSWEGWEWKRGQWIKTDGIVDLRERLRKIAEGLQ
jgi:hypothetical protein